MKNQYSRETHTNLTDSFRLERGGQFESGFQGGKLEMFKKLFSIDSYSYRFATECGGL